MRINTLTHKQSRCNLPVDDTTLYCLMFDLNALRPLPCSLTLSMYLLRTFFHSTPHLFLFLSLFSLSPPSLFLSDCLISGRRIPLISGICSHYKQTSDTQKGPAFYPHAHTLSGTHGHTQRQTKTQSNSSTGHLDLLNLNTFLRFWSYNYSKMFQ